MASQKLAILVWGLVSGALAVSLAGCIADNEAIVYVEPTIQSPSVNVEAGPFGTTLTGAFTLRLRLGPRASGASYVAVNKFAIANADQTISFVETLETKADRALPVTVELDSEESVVFTIDFGGSVLPPMTGEDLCAAGGLRIAGTVTDSLKDGATPVASDVFMPSGCSN